MTLGSKERLKLRELGTPKQIWIAGMQSTDAVSGIQRADA